MALTETVVIIVVRSLLMIPPLMVEETITIFVDLEDVLEMVV